MTDPLEIAANAVTALSILLAGRNSVHTWWTGLVGCVLFGLLFARAQLYADTVLQIFFVGAGALGWWQWLHGGADRQPLPIRRVSRGVLAVSVVVGAAAALGYGALLHFWTDAYAPFLDSLVLSFSVLAQVLLMQRRLESWPVWWLVNSLAIPLFASRGLYVTAALYAAYWIHALIAWRHWWRVMPRTEAAHA